MGYLNDRLRIQQSDQIVAQLLKTTKVLIEDDFRPGSIIFFKYYAKDYDATFDRTPLVLVLMSNSRYVLGLNLHWIPVAGRLWLVDRILEKSKYSIKTRGRLDFKYHDFKQVIRSLHYAPCIRLYIRKRITSRGVRIPVENFKVAARLRTESFTRGRYSASELLQMARAKKRF